MKVVITQRLLFLSSAISALISANCLSTLSNRLFISAWINVNWSNIRLSVFLGPRLTLSKIGLRLPKILLVLLNPLQFGVEYRLLFCEFFNCCYHVHSFLFC